MEEKIKAGIYARVSDHDAWTLDQQRRVMRDYVKQKGWEIALEISEYASATSPRPDRETLLKAVQGGAIQAIIVWKLDRWARSFIDLFTTVDVIAQASGIFVSAQDFIFIDFSSEEGQRIGGYLRNLIRFSTDVTRDNVVAGIKTAVSEGKRPGRPRVSEETHEVVMVLHESGVGRSEIAKRCKIHRRTVDRIIDRDSFNNDTPFGAE
jgi:putative DNA-invertase from lambdoid prophage Rac